MRQEESRSRYNDNEYTRVLKLLLEKRCMRPGIDSTFALIQAASSGVWLNQRCIHVAGTNGKGSVVWKTVSVLENDFKQVVGMYTSPHLFTIRERICIGTRKLISKDDFIDYFIFLETIATENALSLSFFEMLTVMALAFFWLGPNYFAFNHQQEKQHQGFPTFNIKSIVNNAKTPYCSFIVLETGLGGIFDATNVIPLPVCTVVTSIGWDHINILGYTLEEITKQKCGIFKNSCPIVVGHGVTQYNAFHEAVAKLTGCTVHIVEEWSTRGSYNLENTFIALKVVDVLFHFRKLRIQRNLLIPTNMFRRQLVSACGHPMFRLTQLTERALKKISQSLNEWVQKHFLSVDCEASKAPKNIYIDAGHNETALKRVAQDLLFVKLNRSQTYRILWCLSHQRSVSILFPMIEILKNNIKGIHYLNSKHIRTRSVNEIQLELMKNGHKIEYRKLRELLNKSNQQLINLFKSFDSKIAIEKNALESTFLLTLYGSLIQSKLENSNVLICGTFFVIQEIFQFLNLIVDVESDPFDVNEKPSLLS